MRRLQYQTDFLIMVGGLRTPGIEIILDLRIAYSVTPGAPEAGRGYMADPANYDPGAPDVLEIDTIQLFEGEEERAVPPWLIMKITEDKDLHETILTEWRESIAE